PPLGLRRAGVLEVAQEARLEDGHDRAEAHADGGELPEVRHQPRMRIAGEALALDLLAEMVQLVFAQAALEERARVEPRRGVALHVDEIAAVALGGRVPEMIEADVVERR